MASALALLTYPALAAAIGLNDQQAGFLIGAAIHDVAQAIGGGFAFSDQAGEVATVVKLARVAMLVPLLILVSLLLPLMEKGSVADGTETGRQRFTLRQGVPWFIAGFAVLVLLNSALTLPRAIGEWGSETAQFFLLLAVVAAAIKARLSGIMAHGWRSFVPVLVATLTAFALALGFARLI